MNILLNATSWYYTIIYQIYNIVRSLSLTDSITHSELLFLFYFCYLSLWNGGTWDTSTRSQLSGRATESRALVKQHYLNYLFSVSIDSAIWKIARWATINFPKHACGKIGSGSIIFLDQIPIHENNGSESKSWAKSINVFLPLGLDAWFLSSQ